MMNSRIRNLVIVGVVAIAAAAVTYVPASAQLDISPVVWQQINELLQEKESRAPSQQKLSSQLIYAVSESQGQPLTPNVDVMPSLAGLNTSAAGVLVEVRADVTGELLAAIEQLGGTVISSSAADGRLRARIPLDQVEALAALPEVRAIKPAPRPRIFRRTVNRLPPGFEQSRTIPSLARLLELFAPTLSAVGSLSTQGDVSHGSKPARTTYAVNGSPVKVGVLSDSAEATSLLIGTGDLPGDTVIVQEIIGDPGSSEGSAMMEIVYDMAPGVQLFFASAFNGPTSFADNIRTLRNVYGCDIIVDDVSYSDESPFQDGEIAKAVNDVTADGAVYFSSAGNSGNLTNGNSTTWEGDFVNGGAIALLPGYTVHSFSGQTFNRMLAANGVVDLFWSDPDGASSNDYDLFVLNAAGTSVLAASTDIQGGAGNPFEEVFSPSGFPANARVVIAAKAGAAVRALHLDTFNGASLQVATTGATRGHNAALSAMSVAAVFWNSAKTGTRAFVGGVKNPTEVFSSDGPRRVFFTPNGTPVTPGNLLFGTGGGVALAKPDIAAADGVTTRTPGFGPFFGTSAAAPHAAAIAALIRAENPGLSVDGIKNAMRSTALDIRAPGIDRDSGYGLVMAPDALAVAGP